MSKSPHAAQCVSIRSRHTGHRYTHPSFMVLGHQSGRLFESVERCTSQRLSTDDSLGRLVSKK